MVLTSGTRLGPYEILSPLGAGGMGEVYLARDTRLERTVAVKILPTHFSSSPEARLRFEREAKAISKLNHPHICILHDVGFDAGVNYLVMERMEGETLASRLHKGPMQLQQALKYGSEIADALDKAHRCGVVHRDLKPENIMLTPTGSKLLDFGLAKPAAAVATAATVTAAAPNSRVTQEGTIIGTFQYMSPEQIEGKELDGRSDIFSLGAVLYEMITGKRAFEGKSQLSVVSAILEKEPVPISEVKPLTPPGLDHAIRRCLAKDPDERWQVGRDLAMELKWVAEAGSQVATSASAKEPRSRPWFLWAIAATITAVVLAAFLTYQLFTAPPPQVVVSDVAPPPGTNLNSLFGRPTLAPDGHALVFVAQDKTGHTSIWVRSLDGSPALHVAGTEDAAWPFWSFDSRSIAFLSHGKLIGFELPSGPTVTLADNIGSSSEGGSWSRSGTILFIRSQGIFQVPASGGQSTLVLARDISKYTYFSTPSFLPDGKHFLYLATNPSSSDTFYASLDGKENRPLLRGTSQLIYSSGFLLYVRSATLFAQSFNPETGKLAGAPRPIAEQVRQFGVGPAVYSASQNGALIYETNRASAVSQLAWFDRSGKRLVPIGVPDAYYDLRLSPDARRLASGAGIPNADMWVSDLDRNVRMRLTHDPETDKGIPVWSPDGRTLLFSTLRGSKAGSGIFRKASNGVGGEELFFPSDRPDREVWATDWSRDGRFLLLGKGNMTDYSEADIWVLPMIGEKQPAENKPGQTKPVPFLRTAGSAWDAQFSPDGRWVAYTSTESGESQVYVVSFDPAHFLTDSAIGRAPAVKSQISNNTGNTPRWRRDGKELFYLGPENSIMAVEIDAKGGSFEIGHSQRLFTAPVNPFESTFDVTPDGQRFVMSAAPEQGQEQVPLTLIYNWPTRLQEK